MIRSLPISLRNMSLPFSTLSSLLSMHRRRNSIRSTYLVAGSIWGTGLKHPTVY